MLRLVASKLSKITSGGGKAYRYGGEEFAIVFAGKSIEECIPHLEAIREVIANYEKSSCATLTAGRKMISRVDSVAGRGLQPAFR